MTDDDDRQKIAPGGRLPPGTMLPIASLIAAILLLIGVVTVATGMR